MFSIKGGIVDRIESKNVGVGAAKAASWLAGRAAVGFTGAGNRRGELRGSVDLAYVADTLGYDVDDFIGRLVRDGLLSGDNLLPTTQQLLLGNFILCERGQAEVEISARVTAQGQVYLATNYPPMPRFKRLQAAKVRHGQQAAA